MNFLVKKSLSLVKVVAKSNQIAAASRFNFSDVNKVASKLNKALVKELKYERDNYQQDETVQATLAEQGFSLKNIENDQNLELSKTVGNTQVLIQFQSRAPQFDEPEQAEGQEAEEQQQSDYCDFTVYLIKNNQSLVFECSSVDSEISINSLQNVDDYQSHKALNRYERATQSYQGPDISTLDERLQSTLLEYIKSYGVNEEVAALVEHLSLDKEQTLYMQWLEKTAKFTEL